MKNKSVLNNFYLIITGIILGFAFIVAYRGDLGFSRVYTITQLIAMETEIDNIKEEKAIIRHSMTEINEQLSEYKQKINNEGSILTSMENELSKTSMHAGRKKVSGEGIIITLNDSKKVLSKDEDLKWFIIHDIDILELVNELKMAGAEAIEINGVRLGINSSIRCGGPTIIVDNVRNAVPFIIKAIGDSKQLEASMLATGSYLDILEFNSLEVKIERVENMILSEKSYPNYSHMKKNESGELE